MVTWGAADFADSREPSAAIRVVPAVCILLALSAATHRQLDYWASNFDLWSHAIAVTENNFIAQDNLGGALLLLDKPDGAYAHFQAAADINPRDPMSRSNLGAYLQEHGRVDEAIERYQQVIALTSDPGLLSAAYANLGTAFRNRGEEQQATENYEQALRLNSSQPNAYLGLGQVLEKQNKLDKAIENYSRSVELRPTDTGFVLLGHALESAGRRSEALAAYQQALKISPDMVEAQRAVDALTAKSR